MGFYVVSRADVAMDPLYGMPKGDCTVCGEPMELGRAFWMSPDGCQVLCHADCGGPGTVGYDPPEEDVLEHDEGPWAEEMDRLARETW